MIKFSNYPMEGLMNNFNSSFNSYLIGKYKNRLLFSNEYYAELIKIKNKQKY